MRNAQIAKTRQALCTQVRLVNQRYEVAVLYDLVTYVKEAIPDVEVISLEYPDNPDATGLRFGAAHLPGGVIVCVDEQDEDSPYDVIEDDYLWDLSCDLDPSILNWQEFTNYNNGGHYIEIKVAEALATLGPRVTAWFDPAPDLTDTAALEAWLENTKEAS